jgi:hypothetical protein
LQAILAISYLTFMKFLHFVQKTTKKRLFVYFLQQLAPTPFATEFERTAARLASHWIPACARMTRARPSPACGGGWRVAPGEGAKKQALVGEGR